MALARDRLRIIAPREQIGAVTAYLGDSERGLSDLRPMVLGTGMTLGLLLGSIVLPLPGMAFSMGPAAGTLLVGLVFGKVGRIGPFLTTMPHTAGQTMADFGLLAFLAHAGTRAGIQLGTALATGDAGLTTEGSGQGGTHGRAWGVAAGRGAAPATNGAAMLTGALARCR